MNVLSLCDGISCGQETLRRLNIKVDNYFASEINEDSIKVTQHNFPKTIQIGDMTKINNDEFLKSLPKIDLLISGTPCQGLSKTKGSNRKDLEDHRSKLFFDFVDIKKKLLEMNHNTKFFYENVKPNKDTEKIMTDFMGFDPIEFNSGRVSAQNRVRLYWSNLAMSPTEEKLINIEDILFDHDYVVKEIKEQYRKSIRYVVKDKLRHIKWDTSGLGHYSQQNRAYFIDGKMGALPKSGDDKTNIYLGDFKWRKIHPIEAERLQTLPDNYTSIIKSNTKRIGLCGDGWTVDVVKLFFKNL